MQIQVKYPANERIVFTGYEYKISTPTWGWMMERYPGFSCSVKKPTWTSSRSTSGSGWTRRTFFPSSLTTCVWDKAHKNVCVTFWSRLKARHLLCWPKVSQQIWLKKHVRSSSLRRKSLPAEMNSVKQLPQLHDSSQGSWSSWMTLQQEWGLQDKSFCKSRVTSQPAKAKHTLKYHSDV